MKRLIIPIAFLSLTACIHTPDDPTAIPIPPGNGITQPVVDPPSDDPPADDPPDTTPPAVEVWNQRDYFIANTQTVHFQGHTATLAIDGSTLTYVQHAEDCTLTTVMTIAHDTFGDYDFIVTEQDAIDGTCPGHYSDDDGPINLQLPVNNNLYLNDRITQNRIGSELRIILDGNFTMDFDLNQ